MGYIRLAAMIVRFHRGFALQEFQKIDIYPVDYSRNPKLCRLYPV